MRIVDNDRGPARARPGSYQFSPWSIPWKGYPPPMPRISKVLRWTSVAWLPVAAVVVWDRYPAFRERTPLWWAEREAQRMEREAGVKLGVLEEARDRSQSLAIECVWSLIDAGNHDAAERKLDDLEREAPDDHVVCFTRGMLAEARRDRRGAADWFHKAIELNPEDAGYRVSYGNMLRDLGDPRAAADSYRQAIEVSPRDHEAHLELGFLELSATRAEAAEELFRKAIEFDDHDCGLARQALGEALLEQDRLDEALPIYRQAMEFTPENDVIYGQLADALVRLGQKEEARRVLVSGIPNVDQEAPLREMLERLDRDAW